MRKLSFLIPSKGGDDLRNLLQSISDTTDDLSNLEIVLGLDEQEIQGSPKCDLFKTVYFKKGLPIGQMMKECFKISTGENIMLMNDDVIIHTKDWDQIVYAEIEKFPDWIFLIGVNDLIFKKKFFTFPIVSRKFLEFASLGPDYERYKLDDRILFIYKILNDMGFNRIKYLDNVVFEHLNYRIMNDRRVYQTPTNADSPVNKEHWDHDEVLWKEKFPEIPEIAGRLADIIRKGG
jgi:hypothetical protein